MKYKKCLYLLIIFVMAVLLIVFFYNQSQNTKPEVRNINDLKVVSSNGEYILVDSQEPNSSTFSVYKKIDYGNYEKFFSLPGGDNIESRLTCWTDDKIYTFSFVIASYDLATGNTVDTSGLKDLTGNSTGSIDRVFGVYKGYIYYRYTAGSITGYKKVSLDFKNVVSIEKDEVPKFLIN